jgi:hypothetical protein
LLIASVQPPAPGYLKVDELLQLVVQRAGISSAQAALAVSAMLDYLKARLPSPLVGRICEQLGELPGPHRPDVGSRGVR